MNDQVEQSKCNYMFHLKTCLYFTNKHRSTLPTSIAFTLCMFYEKRLTNPYQLFIMKPYDKVEKPYNNTLKMN